MPTGKGRRGAVGNGRPMAAPNLKAIIILSAFIIFHAAASFAAQAQPAPDVWVTQPWIAAMARFIAVSTLNVRPMCAWGGDGSLRVIRRPPRGATVIALDTKDADKYGLRSGRYGLHLMYEHLPIADLYRNAIQFDPSMLPFMSQRLLVILSKLNQDNYSFYQRRLAEFQSRVESTVEVGRSQIRGVKMLDLAGAVSPWIEAAATDAVRPPPEVWAAWAKGERAEELLAAVTSAQNRGWWIVTDTWTPARIAAAAASAPRKVKITPSDANQDLFEYLQDIYLQMWNVMAKR
ncbi:hypothetical protein FACS1894167_02290 [Synergistales bacterium]|nr:hypothetical protein FACS1894167_02290 [Synergistales bacterium]